MSLWAIISAFLYPIVNMFSFHHNHLITSNLIVPLQLLLLEENNLTAIVCVEGELQPDVHQC